MKTIISIFLLSAILLSCSYKTGRVPVCFNAQQTKQDLIQLKDSLNKQGINLNYEKLEFDSTTSKLSFISFSVECKLNSGVCGGSAHSVINDTISTGFTINYFNEGITVGAPTIIKKQKI
jgi:hypothetical protein